LKKGIIAVVAVAVVAVVSLSVLWNSFRTLSPCGMLVQFLNTHQGGRWHKRGGDIVRFWLIPESPGGCLLDLLAEEIATVLPSPPKKP
jgi:hypothetical protein